MRSRVNKHYDYDDSDVVCERLKQLAYTLIWILAILFGMFCEPIATFLGF